jgi:CHC2-type zinc finger protein
VKDLSTHRTAATAHAFRKEFLPPPDSFYRQELGKLSRPSRGWVKANCCFHQSKSHTSFSIHLDSGAFYCHGCGAKGGDIVSFLRQRDGLGFKDACRQLGAWDEGKERTSKPLRRMVPYLVLDFVIDGVEYHASVKDEPRNYADKIRRFYREASDRLIELSQGDSERYAGEQENCWARMECAQDELRELETYE